MVMDIETFEYIVKNEDEEIVGGYTSSEEPPMKGEILHLANLHHWDWVEILAVSMLLGKHENQVVLKVRKVDIPAHWVGVALEESDRSNTDV